MAAVPTGSAVRRTAGDVEIGHDRQRPAGAVRDV